MKRCYTPILLIAFLTLSCETDKKPSQPISPITPQANAQVYQNQMDGIAFQYPAGWKTSSPKGTEYHFTAPDVKQPAIELVLNVPKLPWHPAGWIPLDRVRDGYIDDAKKKIPDAHVEYLPDPNIADAKVHRVKLTGQTEGKLAINEAVTIVHNDKVYILSIEIDPAGYPTAQKALQLAVSTLKWSPK